MMTLKKNRIKLCMITLSIVLYSLNIMAGSSLTITAPTINDPSIQTAINDAASALQTKLNDDYFSKFADFSKMSRGFANSAAAVSYAGENQSFQNYSLFSITGGFLAGVSTTHGKITADKTKSDIEKNGDTYIGISPAFAVSIGLPVPSVLKGLYVNGKVGGFSVKTKMNDFRYENSCFLIGAAVNYLIVDGHKLNDVIRWRGLTIGTGINYIRSSSEVSIPLSNNYSEPWVSGGTSGILRIQDLRLELNADATSITFPMEVLSSFQIFSLLNLGTGAGIDINCLHSTVETSGHASIRTTLPPGVIQTAPGSLSFSSKTDSHSKSYEIFSPKIMTSIGLNLSVIKIDVPFIYYPVSKTYATGITLGAVW
jgi:hypothetical protein